MAVDLSKELDSSRRGVRHDGDALTTSPAGIRHIRGVQDKDGVPTADKPAILALDYNGGGGTPVASDSYVLAWAAVLGASRHLRISGVNDDPDTLNEDADGFPCVIGEPAATLVKIKHLPAVTKFGIDLTIAHGLSTALAVFVQIETDSAAPAATDTCAVFTKINGANIEYDCYEEDFVTASATAMGGIDFLVIGI